MFKPHDRVNACSWCDGRSTALALFALLPPRPRFTYSIRVMSAEQKLTEAMCNLSTEDVAARAAELKAAGNKLFTEKKYDEAIKVYGDAIAVQENAILYCNRAASHLALQS